MVYSILMERAAALGLSLDARQAEQFSLYHRLLADANRNMNLTRVDLDDESEAVDHHYLDSIAPLAAAKEAFEGIASLIDVGAGAGLPGIPLSILLPNVRVTLLDSLQKRVRFLDEVIAALGLNARAVHLRAEDAAHDAEYRERFDMVTARAVAALPQLLELTLPFARVTGHLALYKGPSLDGELPLARHALAHLGGGAERAVPIKIPGRDWDHRLLLVQKRRPSPKPYPRKPAEIAKRPL